MVHSARSIFNFLIFLFLTYSFGCSERLTSHYKEAEYYFDLDTLFVNEFKMEGILLDNSKDELLKLDSIVDSGYGTDYYMYNWGKFYMMSKHYLENYMGTVSDTFPHMIESETLFLGENSKLSFVERPNEYTLQHCNFFDELRTIRYREMGFSPRTRLKETLNNFPLSAKWVNHPQYMPGGENFHVPYERMEKIYFKDLDWIPFSDGDKGVVHLVFWKGKLVLIERAWSDF